MFIRKGQQTTSGLLEWKEQMLGLQDAECLVDKRSDPKLHLDGAL